jgi:hypothetical protein
MPCPAGTHSATRMTLPLERLLDFFYAYKDRNWAIDILLLFAFNSVFLTHPAFVVRFQ